MNRLSTIGPMILLAAPIALMLIALGVERVGLRNGRLVKVALAVNTCLVFFSIFAWGNKAVANDMSQVNCYETSVLPYLPGFGVNEGHAAFTVLSKLDANIEQAINKGEYDRKIYLELKSEISRTINILRVGNKLSFDEASVARVYFDNRLQSYADVDVQIMCYFGW